MKSCLFVRLQIPKLCVATFVFLANMLGWTLSATAQSTETVLYSFSGLRDGAEPISNLALDQAGNIYGTTAGGGNDSGNTGCLSGRCGVAFKLSLDASGGWTETLLHLFSGGLDGMQPEGMILDNSGNLYGTAQRGGNLSGCQGFGCGVVYRLSPNGSGGWNQTVLYAFTGGSDGAFPNGGLVLDAQGNLYGTAWSGGSTTNCLDGCGVVFKLSRAVGSWKISVLHTFMNGEDGTNPAAPIIFDQAGNLYGTTYGGGKGGGGTAFMLTKTSSGKWKADTLHAFTGGADGGAVNAGLIMDSAGNLYGTTQFGGSGNCSECGVIYELSNSSTGWRQTVLYTFTGKFGGDGAVSYAPLVLDGSGNLYGTTEEGGNLLCVNDTSYCGVVFKLSPSLGSWSENVVYAFSGKDGANPLNGLTLDSSGHLYGVTRFGGTTYAGCSHAGCGVVFSLTP